MAVIMNRSNSELKFEKNKADVVNLQNNIVNKSAQFNVGKGYGLGGNDLIDKPQTIDQNLPLQLSEKEIENILKEL